MEEMKFAVHLSLPAIMMKLKTLNCVNFARCVYQLLNTRMSASVRKHELCVVCACTLCIVHIQAVIQCCMHLQKTLCSGTSIYLSFQQTDFNVKYNDSGYSL